MPAAFLGRLLGFPSPSQIPWDSQMHDEPSPALRLFAFSSCCSRQLSRQLGTLWARIRASIFALSPCQDQHSHSMEKYPSSGSQGIVRGSRAVSRHHKCVVEKTLVSLIFPPVVFPLPQIIQDNAQDPRKSPGFSWNYFHGPSLGWIREHSRETAQGSDAYPGFST